MKYYVEIVEYETDKVIKKIECRNYRHSEKVDGGVNINLNHDEFFTRIVEGYKVDNEVTS